MTTEGTSPFGAYAEKLFETQAERKTSLEQRALAVITTSGVLATLLFGLTAFLSQTQAASLASNARGPLVAAMASFVVAAVLALLVNVPLFYLDVELGETSEQLRVLWSKTEIDADILIASTRLKVVRRAKLVNTIKAWLLVAAFLGEMIAVLAMAISLGGVLNLVE